MKKLTYYLLAAVAACMFISCNETGGEDPPPVTEPVKMTSALAVYDGSHTLPYYRLKLTNSTLELSFLIISAPTEDPAVIPSGKYTTNQAPEQNVILIAEDSYYIANGGKHQMNSANLEITYSDGKYVVTGKVEDFPNNRARSLPSQYLDFKYEGAIEVDNVEDKYKDYLRFSSALAKRQGLYEKGAYEIHIFLANSDMDDTHGMPSGEGEYLRLALFSNPPTKERVLDAGRYEFSNESRLWALKGRSTSYYELLTAEGSARDVPPGPGDPEPPGPPVPPGPGPITSEKNVLSGYVDVQFNNGSYTIVGEITVGTTDSPEDVKFIYRGELPLVTFTRPYSRLESDYAAPEFTIAYYQREMNLEYDDYKLDIGWINLQTEGYRTAQTTDDLGPDDCSIAIYITFDKETGQLTEITPGNYTGFISGDWVPGRYGYGDINVVNGQATGAIGTWMHIGKFPTNDVPISDETLFNIRKNGNTYTIEFEFYDDNIPAKKITGRYQGPIELRAS